VSDEVVEAAAARDRTLALLGASARETATIASGGYVDLLGTAPSRRAPARRRI